MKQIEACTSGRWTSNRAVGCSEWGPASVVSEATRQHETRADLDTPRTRAAVVWRIEHRDDYANTVF